MYKTGSKNSGKCQCNWIALERARWEWDEDAENEEWSATRYSLRRGSCGREFLVLKLKLKLSAPHGRDAIRPGARPQLRTRSTTCDKLASIMSAPALEGTSHMYLSSAFVFSFFL